MKHILGLVAILCISIVSNAQSIRWINSEYDFGAFKEDSGLVSCQFKGINIANEPIAIINARATCGCTTPRYPHGSINQGDTIVVSVSYDPQARPGRFSKKIYIKNNIDDEQDQLTIRGVVIGTESTLKSRYPIEWGNLRSQNEIVFIGDVKKGKSKSIFFSVYNQSTDTISPFIKDVPSYIKASIIPSEIPPGEQASVAFYFDAFYCDKWGAINKKVTLVTDKNSEESFPIEFIANVIPDFSKMTPGEQLKAPKVEIENECVDFGRVNRNEESLTKEFVIKNQGKDVLDIYRVYSPDEGIELNVEKTKIKGGRSTNVRVTVIPSQLKGELLNATIKLVVNDPINPQPIVRVVGELK